MKAAPFLLALLACGAEQATLTATATVESYVEVSMADDGTVTIATNAEEPVVLVELDGVQLVLTEPGEYTRERLAWMAHEDAEHLAALVEEGP